MGRAYEIGSTYRDTGSFRNADDQFLRWLRGPLDSGIKNTGGIRILSAEESETPAAIVLVSNAEGTAQHTDDWDDKIAVESGYVEYWGDGKAGKPYDESTRNRRIKAAFEQASKGNRDAVPPVLFFQKPEKGVVRFGGLCIPADFEVKSYLDESDQRVPNYLFHFSILDAERVPVSWLHHRARPSVDGEPPAAWREWVETGTARVWPLGERFEDTAGRVARSETRRVTVSDAFRAVVFERYSGACAVTGMAEEDLLDVAHVVPRRERPEIAEDPDNALILNTLHHQAFDRHLFTIDRDYRLRVKPEFDPSHPFLRETIVERDGRELSIPEGVGPDPSFFEAINTDLAWL